MNETTPAISPEAGCNPAPAEQASSSRRPRLLRLLSRTLHLLNLLLLVPALLWLHLSKLTGVDFAPCHWDGHEFFCHTMLVFNFSDGQHLVVSPETRLPEGEEQNGLAGLYKRYGILYVFGSEDDIFALRSNYRHEDLYLFPMNVTPEQAQALLRHIVAIARQSSERHEAYNTLTDNCSTAIVKIFSPMRKLIPLQYRLLPINNGRIAELLYRFGGLKAREGESWQQLRERCRVGYDITPAPGQSYSQALRLRTEHPDAETAARP